MYQLVIANKNYSSWSLRPWVLMRALGIPFEERLHVFNEPGFAPDAPAGRVPYLIDGARTVWDSLGVVEYLAERHDGVWPAGDDARAWARCAAAEMHSGFSALRNVCSMSVGVEVELFEIGPDLLRDVSRIEALWTEGLARFGGPYLAGSAFTAVDAFYAPVVFRFLTYGIELGPEAADYVDRIRQLPAMIEWYDAALSETWRDEPHEVEIAAAGRIVRDLRA